MIIKSAVGAREAVKAGATVLGTGRLLTTAETGMKGPEWLLTTRETACEGTERLLTTGATVLEGP